jgi:ABC-2 type transport system permease protein
MPIFDQGYQHWQGVLSGRGWRWVTIARHGVRAQLKNPWTRRVLFLAWVPALLLAGLLIFWGLLEQKSPLLQSLRNLIRSPEIANDPRAYRVMIWTLAYKYFFDIEMFFTMILVVLVGPGLISQDLRFNAIPLYFSRPLRRADYFLGKLGVIASFLVAVVVVPALIGYLLGVCFSLDFSILKDTFRILLAGIVYGLVVALSAGTLMLALSSLSRSSRHVAMFWVGIWFVTHILAAVFLGLFRASGAILVSYTGNLEKIAGALLDTESAWRQAFKGWPPAQREQMLTMVLGPYCPWYWSALVLAGLFGVSLWILTFRVRSLDRLK